ncbi:MAG TPA: rRNA adenine N-6-methyltransferase family protein, partial [bacterium]|nr:rRNA adenine N-6-methyltransferase family protein [bacterium]
MKHTAKKSLGQHFLVDDNVVRKIINTFSPRRSQLVVEIGPGEGALTRYLAELEIETIAIEVDETRADHLRSRFGEGTSVDIRHQ